jgi:hypothetical protein
LAALLSAGAFAQVPLRDDNSGPYNVPILEGGEGLTRKLEPGTASLDANGAWSMTGGVNPRRIEPGPATLLAVGKTPADACPLLGDGNLALRQPGAGQRQRHRERLLDRDRSDLRRHDCAPYEWSRSNRKPCRLPPPAT